ncbi:MAG: DUF4867 family protein [Clostridia bacterium]|nr:DUF4867 family protein [Clostridia bacterium]
MKILTVMDPEFRPYGRVVTGYPVQGILEALAKTPLPEGVGYVPREESLHLAPDAEAVGEALFGGMPFQLGWCNGHNTVMNCLKYHRDSEFNLAAEDLVLLVAKQQEIENGCLDTAKVKAFLLPKGVLIETYATTLHYAPCHKDPQRGFKMLVALPANTNTPYKGKAPANEMARFLWARNKWLLAHADSPEAKEGAVVALVGENIDIAKDL